jgi:YD repeat-containing protein
LGRLRSAANPESGIISYQYDNANNLTAKADARGIITNYAYDVLNRVTGTTYSDGTPAVTYTYDTAPTYGLGRLAQVSNNISTTSMSYDAMGRVVTSQQTTDGQTYSFSYGYNYAGALVAETYPSGRVLTTGYDPANRATGISGTLHGGVTNYAASATYAAHGALAQVWYGNNLVDNYVYNNRLQVSSFSTNVNNNGSNTFLQLQPQWGTTNNNGNLQGMDEYNGGLPLYPGWLHFTESYLYDGVDRLAYALDSSSNCSPAANYACWFRGSEL